MGGKAGDRQDSLSRTGGRWWAVAGGSRHKDFTGGMGHRFNNIVHMLL